MCGIYGLISTFQVPDDKLFKTQLLAAQQALRHRGPDDQGLEIFALDCEAESAYKVLAMGQTRLSIIDLSTAGHQPMHSSDGRYTIIFNGEIYNYKELRQELIGLGNYFRTNSDTEVLLTAWRIWGASGLRRLIGMFAFAVYDRAEKSLTLARDAFGIKPLYYQNDSESIRFASEIQAIFCLQKNKPIQNLDKVNDYLMYGTYDESADTFFYNIKNLSPGHTLTINLNNLSIEKPIRWWWPSIIEKNNLSFENAAEQLREIFLKNIRLHLRSDVPIGATLSGGIDSSAVVCAMRYIESDMPIHTFSYVARGSSVNEEKWIDMVNKKVTAIPHKIWIQPNELIDDLDDLISSQGEPFGTTSIYAQYRIFKSVKEAGITVILDGQGADELLAGYSGYPHSFVESMLETHDYISLLKFLTEWSQWPGRGFKNGVSILGSVLFSAYKQKVNSLVPNELRYSKLLKTILLLKQDKKSICKMNAVDSKINKGRRLMEKLRSSMTGGELSRLLRHGDRNSMRWSVESRVPFLSIELAEFVLSLPESYLLSKQGETKSIFRAAMRGIVPDEILDRKDKIGFQTPENEWLRELEPDFNKLLSKNNAFELLSALKNSNPNSSLVEENFKNLSKNWTFMNYVLWTGLTCPAIK
jgi:asparagine synthase (glutamine-hydrolysing)